MSEKVELTPVDGVEVTVVMDNAIDILAAPADIKKSETLIDLAR